MPKSDAVRIAEIQARSKDRENVLRILADPQLLNLVILLGGLWAAQRIPYSDDETRNDLMRGLATSGVVLTALSRAGMSGWPALAAGGIAGSAGGGLFDFLGAKDAGTFLLGADKKLFGIPIPGLS
jgi:hypothetical protein